MFQHLHCVLLKLKWKLLLRLKMLTSKWSMGNVAWTMILKYVTAIIWKLTYKHEIHSKWLYNLGSIKQKRNETIFSMVRILYQACIVVHRQFAVFSTGISCVQFDDTRIVSGSSDKTIKVNNVVLYYLCKCKGCTRQWKSTCTDKGLYKLSME